MHSLIYLKPNEKKDVPFISLFEKIEICYVMKLIQVSQILLQLKNIRPTGLLSINCVLYTL